MIIAFESQRSDVLDRFLYNYENPRSTMASLSKLSFIEFKVERRNDLVIIKQTHLYDVVAKWLLMAAVGNVLLWYVFKYQVLFFISFLFVLVGVLWLSRYVRFYALRFNLWRKGHRLKVRLLSDSELIERLLLED